MIWATPCAPLSNVVLVVCLGARHLPARQVLNSLSDAVLANAEQQARLQSGHRRRGSQALAPRLGRYPGMRGAAACLFILTATP